MTEADLLERLKQDDMSALQLFIDKYGGYVAAVISHTLGAQAQKEDCEELASDVFVTLWQKAKRLRPDSHLKPWLAVVARNRSLNWVREQQQKRTRKTTMDTTALDELVAADNQDALDLLARNQMIDEALDILDEDIRDLMERYYFEGYNIKDLVDETGYSESMIKSRLFRGRKQLRLFLCQKGYAP